MDLSALRKFEVHGADAFALLQISFSRDVGKLAVGQSAYGCLLNPTVVLSTMVLYFA
jgi:aminomethyltransferase